MRKHFLFRLILILGFAIFALQGCGGDSDGGDSPVITTPDVQSIDDAKSGIFVDSPVSGLGYITGDQAGITDLLGGYTYEEGNSIRFFIGDVVLGEAHVGPMLTPINLVPNAVDEMDPTVTNIARFLQTLDDDADPANGITISEVVRSNSLGKSIDFNQSIAEFESDGDVQITVADLTSMTQAGARLLIPAEEAQENMRSAVYGAATSRCVSPPCVRINKIWSDQFPGIVANFFPGGTGNRGYPYILMGARSNSIAYAKASISITPNTPEIRDKIRVRFTPVTGGSLPLPVDFGSIDSTGTEASVWFLPPLDARSHQIVAWIDDDIDNRLDQDETFSLSDGFIRAVSREHYLSAQAALIAGSAISYLDSICGDCPDARSFLTSFARNTTPQGASRRSISVSTSELTHSIGAFFDNNGNANINEYVFNKGGSLWSRVLSSNAFDQLIRKKLNEIRGEVQQMFTCEAANSFAEVPISVNENILFREADKNLKLAFGTATIRFDLTVAVVESGGALALDSLTVSNGTLTDLYDWDFEAHPLLDATAAMVQAGYNTLKPSGGQVFKTKVILDSTLPVFPFNFGQGAPNSSGDRDGDGVQDNEDAFPCDPNEWEDTDGDGIGDNADPDDDNDGIPDEQDPDPKDPDNPTCDSQPTLPVCAPDPTFIQPSINARRAINDGSTPILEIKRGVSSNGLIARLEVPYKNALVRGNIPIFGQAHGSNFKQFRIEVGKGVNPTEWITLETSTTPQTDKVTAEDLDDSMDITIHGNLTTWDTGLKNYVYLPSHPKDHPINLKGAYTLRLVVVGNDGASIEDRVTVNVANVIPNAWGGKVTSQDGRFELKVPEQAIRHTFRLLLAEPADVVSALLPGENKLIGKIYKVTEARESFTKNARLEIAYSENDLGELSANKLAIFGFDSSSKQWELLNSYRHRDSNSLYTMLRELHSHYAIMASEEPRSTEWALSEPDSQHGAIQNTALKPSSEQYLVRNDFESGLGQWSNRDGAVGATLELDSESTFDNTKVLKLSNTNFGGNFAVNVVSEPFDVRNYPTIQFDYRISKEVKTNFLVKVSGRWYEIGFTDDEKELHNKRVNIAHIGDIKNVITDGQWHTAQFNLYNMLKTRTGHTVVDKMIMADWDVIGYMKLQYGSNVKGATYYIDNFSIMRSPDQDLRLAGERALIDDFNQKKLTNHFGGYYDTFEDSVPNELNIEFSEQTESGNGNALVLKSQLDGENSYNGYITHLPNIDLREFQGLSLKLQDDVGSQNAMIGVRDHTGRESKISLQKYYGDDASEGWHQVSIPLVAFSVNLDWSMINAITVSFEQRLGASGKLAIDDLAFDRNIVTFLVDDFEQETSENLLGQQHLAYAEGAAAVNGRHTHNSPNGIYSLSYGGNIGAINAYASGLKSFAGWMSKLGGIDCTQCETLSFRVRGAEGGENFTVYLNDGNFEWGFPMTEHESITSEWKTVNIPIANYSDYGVDLSHLDAVKLVFEGSRMSGTIYIDDIRLGNEH